jgi:NADH-quinone oxidoreductase subunit N
MSSQSFLALAPILILTVTVVIVMLAIAVRRSLALSGWITMTGLALALLVLLAHFAWPGSFPMAVPQTVTPLLIIDQYACVYMALTLIAALASATLSLVYLRGYGGHREELFLLLTLSALGGLVLAASRHFAAFFLGLELLSVPMYGMAAYLVEEQRSLEAGLKYLVLSAVASAFILFGMALVYAESGTLVFSEIGARLAGGGNGVALLGAVMLLVGVGFKLSLAPFHLWTPDVYQGSPAPVTLYLATASKIPVFALLLRYVVESGAARAPVLVDLLAGVAVLSILLGNVMALRQPNLKRLMAYSSIAHFGYALVAVAAYGALSAEAVGLYLATYLVGTGAIFGAITLLSSPYGGREAEDLSDYQGLFWREPMLAAILSLSLLSLAGVPFTAGFIGKLYVLGTGVDLSAWLLVSAVIIGSGLGLYYYLRAMVQLYLRPAPQAPFHAPQRWSASLGGAALILLALAVLALGILPEPFIDLVRAAAPQQPAAPVATVLSEAPR